MVKGCTLFATLLANVGAEATLTNPNISSSVIDAELSVASAVGDFMGDWVTQQEGTRVGSDASGHSQTECWDLAMAAIEQARKNGFTVNTASPGSYKWSDQTVSVQDAEVGDILQFANYREKYCSGGGCQSKYTADRHTAVVTKSFDSSTCGIQVEEQNPNPVHQSVYHPCGDYQTAGSVIVYRLSSSSPSPTPSPSPGPSPSGCSDTPSDWVSGGASSSDRETCSAYESLNYCTTNGGEGSGWKSRWGKITDFANSNGISALDACCACGGGSNGMKTDAAVVV